MTLTTRLSVFFLSMLAFVLVGFSVTLYVVADRYLYQQVEERLDALLNNISGGIEANPQGVEWEPETRHFNLDSAALGDHFVWVVATNQGRIIAQSDQKNLKQFLKEMSPALQPQPRTSGIVKWRGTTWTAGQRSIHADSQTADHVNDLLSQTIDQESGYPALSITAGASLAPIKITLRRLGMSLMGLSAGIWFVAFFAGRYVCRQALRPLSQMTVAVREIDADDLEHQRLPAISSKDELEELSRSFNNLLDRLHEAFERQQRFTGDASHQLRTPLTAILGQLEVTLRRDRSGDEYRQVLDKVYQRARHLAQMVESLLFLARANAEAQLPTLETLDLTQWLPEYSRKWSDHERAKDLAFEYMNNESCPANVQPALLAELLNILLDNACKYSKPGAPIRVQLERSETSLLLKVEDKGCGIEERDLATVFVPFFRSTEALRQGIEGVGLGLSIAKRLAESFQGKLSVTSHLGHGSCFVLQLSLATPTAC